MELSAKHEWRSVHVLGYLFDPAEPYVVSARRKLASALY